MDSCVFCKIVSGDTFARMVAADSVSIAFHPLNPVTKGHILVVPNKHVRDFTEDPEVSAGVMAHASRLAHFLGGDCNLITSKGPLATQTVQHLHLHLIPRRPGDGLHLPWTGQSRDGGESHG
jgi:histidine triad (HIT) family protein